MGILKLSYFGAILPLFAEKVSVVKPMLNAGNTRTKIKISFKVRM